MTPKDRSLIKQVTLKGAAAHFRTITRHKWLVMKGCFAVGLYRQGIFHDLSKYSPEEFLVGAAYYQGNRSPNNAEREAKGYSSAWLHHKGRNKHHYEYWFDYDAKGKHDVEGALVSIKMPGRYVVEMFMDRIAASKVYRGSAYTDSDALRYFRSGAKNDVLIHPETAKLLSGLLEMLSEEGEEKTFAYIRSRLVRRRSGRKRSKRTV